MKTIVFVCHGNICRSAAAEYIAKKYIKEHNLEDKIEVFSRATSLEEIGNDIYPPMKRELLKRGIPFGKHFAERISQRDYDLSDYVFCMDENNKRYLSHLLDDYKGIIKPITVYESFNEIEDPWYTDRYEKVCDQLELCISHILSKLN